MLSTTYAEEPILDNQLQSASLDINGYQRDFLWYAPNEIRKASSLLFVLHGSTGSGDEIREQMAYQFDQLADKEGFVVVYPTGYFNHWNDCRGSASYEANKEDVDDIAFLKAIENYLSDTLDISFAYRFATGHSNGGHFCFKLALEAPDWIDAIAPISANLPIEENLDCYQKNQFVPMVLINGTDDSINPYNGGLVTILGDSSRGTVLATEKTIAYWTNLGGCEFTPKITSIQDFNPKDDSKIEVQDWLCGTIPKVRLYKVLNGGHTIPTTKHKFPRIMGKTNQDMDAPVEIWNFFKEVSQQ